MSTNVTWNGTVYSIPAAGEVNWPSLSSFLIALGNNAAIAEEMKQAVRVATTTPVTVSDTTDCVVVTNMSVASAVAVNLPAGSTGRIFFVVDGKGDAATNNITIDGNGAETINGSANYVISDNRGGVALAWNGTGWNVIARFISGSILTNPLGDGFVIDGASDEIQLRVQAHSTQTSDILVVEQSDGDDVFHVDNSGRAAIGNGTAIQANTGLTVGTTADNTSNAEIALIAANTGQSIVNLGDTDSRTVGRVKYNHTDETMELIAGSTTSLRVDSSGRTAVGSGSTIQSFTALTVGTTADNTSGAEAALIAPNTGQSILNLGDTDSRTVGRVKYNHTNNSMEIITNASTQIGISSTGAVTFPNIGTTGSAANAFLDSGASNNLLRSTSSIKYKHDVMDVAESVAISNLRPVTYRSKASADDPDRRYLGFIAEEVHHVEPMLVHYQGGEPDGVMYDRVVVLLVKEVQRLQKVVADLQEKVL